MSEATKTADPAQPVGTVVEFKASAPADVMNPHGTVYTFVPDSRGVVAFVLDRAGDWVADVAGKPVTFKAV